MTLSLAKLGCKAKLHLQISLLKRWLLETLSSKKKGKSAWVALTKSKIFIFQVTDFIAKIFRAIISAADLKDLND